MGVCWGSICNQAAVKQPLKGAYDPPENTTFNLTFSNVLAIGLAKELVTRYREAPDW